MNQNLNRVVLIGFNKCATRSLANLFHESGHKTLHHKISKPFRRQNAAKIIKTNLASGKKILHGIESYVFYADLNYQTRSETFEACLHYRDFLRDYPGTVLILNIRNREDWIRSRVLHGHGEFLSRTMKANQFSNPGQCEQFWRMLWDAHLTDVRSFIVNNTSRIIEFNIDTEDIQKLIDALPEYELKKSAWRSVGKSDRYKGLLSFRKIRKIWSFIKPRTY